MFSFILRLQKVLERVLGQRRTRCHDIPVKTAFSCTAYPRFGHFGHKVLLILLQFKGHRDVAKMSVCSGIAFQPSTGQLAAPNDIVTRI